MPPYTRRLLEASPLLEVLRYFFFVAGRHTSAPQLSIALVKQLNGANNNVGEICCSEKLYMNNFGEVFAANPKQYMQNTTVDTYHVH